MGRRRTAQRIGMDMAGEEKRMQEQGEPVDEHQGSDPLDSMVEEVRELVAKAASRAT